MGIFTSLSSQLYALKPVSVTEDYMGVSMEKFSLYFTYMKLLKIVSHSQNDCCRAVDIQLTHKAAGRPSKVEGKGVKESLVCSNKANTLG